MHLGLLEQMPKSGVQRRRIMDFIYSLRDSSRQSGRFFGLRARRCECVSEAIGDYAIYILG
jgi:hypothetical protein